MTHSPTPRPHSRLAAPRRGRRALLGGLGLLLFAAGPVSVSCSTGFDPPSEIKTLRILAVTADKSYAQPGDEVTFEMTVYDGLGDADGVPRPIQITWLGGCFSPEGDQYYACYPQLAGVLQSVATGSVPPAGLVAQGVGLDTFTLAIPEDIITRRPPPQSGPYTGVAFLFFTACAGEVRPVGLEGGSEAGSFPLGCFEIGTGKRLGPESFVPGYTQIFAFDDGRTNANPALSGAGITFGGADWGEGVTMCAEVCPVTEAERQEQGSCAENAQDTCTTYDIKVAVPSDVGEVDPGDGSEGETLTEVVWVRYYAEGGDIDGDTKLINDAVEGYQDGFEMTWVPPDEPGSYSVWAVVHDSRGGATVVRRDVTVFEPGVECNPGGGIGGSGGAGGAAGAGGSGGAAGGNGGAGGTGGQGATAGAGGDAGGGGSAGSSAGGTGGLAGAGGG